MKSLSEQIEDKVKNKNPVWNGKDFTVILGKPKHPLKYFTIDYAKMENRFKKKRKNTCK